MLLSRSKARQLHRQGSVEEYKCQEARKRGLSIEALQDRRQQQVHAAAWACACAPGASASSCGRSPGSAGGPRSTPTLREHARMWLVATQHLPLWSLSSDANALFLFLFLFDTSHGRGMLSQHASEATM